MIKVVGGLITHGDKFLVAERAYGNLKGHWEFPGGKIEPGENLFDAIKREIKEELALDIEPKKVINTFTHTYPFDTVELTLIQCDLVSDLKDLVSDGSHDGIDWVTLDKIDKAFAPLDEKVKNYLVENKISFS